LSGAIESEKYYPEGAANQQQPLDHAVSGKKGW